MNQIIKFPKRKPQPTRLELLKKVVRTAAREGEADLSNATVEFLLTGRKGLLTIDLAEAIRIAEQIGIWAGWRMGGRPKYHWPTSARRPDLPQNNHRRTT